MKNEKYSSVTKCNKETQFWNKIPKILSTIKKECQSKWKMKSTQVSLNAIKKHNSGIKYPKYYPQLRKNVKVEQCFKVNQVSVNEKKYWNNIRKVF